MASTIKVDTVTTPDGTGNITISRPIVADGTNLTNLPAANLTGTTAIANGGTGITAVGTSGNVLTSTGSAWASTALPAGGGWQYVSVATASNSATLAFTNMEAGYDYQYVYQTLRHATNATSALAQVGVTTPTYRTADYISTAVGVSNAGSGYSGEITSSILIVHNAFEDMGNQQTNEALYRYVLELSDPAGTTYLTSWRGFGTLYGGSPALIPYWSNGIYNGAAEAHTAIKFYSSSGNLTAGKIYQYRRSIS